jgi:hypothetical protein
MCQPNINYIILSKVYLWFWNIHYIYITKLSTKLLVWIFWAIWVLVFFSSIVHSRYKGINFVWWGCHLPYCHGGLSSSYISSSSSWSLAYLHTKLQPSWENVKTWY